MTAPEHDRAGGRTIPLIAGIHAALWFAMLVAVVGVARMERLFVDFGVDLPGVTVAVITLTRPIRGSALAGLIVLGVVALVDWAVLTLLNPMVDRRPLRAWSWLMAVVPVVVGLVVVLAMLVPYLALHGKLAG